MQDQVEDGGFRPASMYGQGIGGVRRRVLQWFHRDRLDSFNDFIDGEQSGVAASIGCGTGEFEKHRLQQKFSEVVGVEVLSESVTEASGKITAVQGDGCRLPFSDESLDALVAVGSVEHLPDEKQLISEANRCLKEGGAIYLTAPIEVGIGGYLRYCGREFIHSNHRYFGYTLGELTKRVARDMHGTSHDHRYYNYRYLLRDIRETFADVEVQRWPINVPKTPNLITFIKAKKPSDQI